MIDQAKLVAAVRSVVGERTAALHEPEFGGNEADFLRACLDSTFVSTVGEYVPKFERMLCEFTGARYAIAVVNGTAAIQVALVLAGVQPGDEVLMPALTFVGTANAVSHAGAIPHFLDSEAATLGLAPAAMREHLRQIARVEGTILRNRTTGRRIAAVVPVHVCGHPVDMPALLDVCAEFSLPIVEDAAESLGSFRAGRHTGTDGLLSALSFNGNKIITTGGGGAILTNDERIAARGKHLTTTAKRPHAWRFDHDAVGWNYRLPNLNASLGCAQMERLATFLAAKRKLAHRYAEAFAVVDGVEFVSEPAGCISNYWLNGIRVLGADYAARDAALESLNAAGYGARPLWTLMHKLPMYATAPRATLDCAERLEREVINLPSGFGIAKDA